jgi:hypothetical protein
MINGTDHSKYEQPINDIIATVQKHPGITTGALTSILVDGHGIDKQVASTLISQLAQQHKFVRTRNRRNVQQNGYYFCWPTVPPNVPAEDFEVIARKTTKRVVQQLREAGILPQQAASQPQQAAISPPEVSPMPEAPVAAPAPVFGVEVSIRLTMPDGHVAQLSMQQASQLYETLCAALERR